MPGRSWGPLGAFALVVGLIPGAGEAVALVLRLLSGPLADRRGNYGSLTILGYAMTAICVPPVAVAPFVGSLGLALAATLILLERAGKAIRSPSKSAVLARVAMSVGRGRGFAVHKALDRVGRSPAVPGRRGHRHRWRAVGRLRCAGRRGGWVHTAAAHPQAAHRQDTQPHGNATASPAVPVVGPTAGSAPVSSIREPRARSAQFYAFATSCALGTPGLMTFGVISYYLVDAGLVDTLWFR